MTDIQVRTISEILKEADVAVELQELCDAWMEIVEHKYKYPLIELWFAKEHLEKLARQMAERDVNLKQLFK